jgi:hypothetical protein
MLRFYPATGALHGMRTVPAERSYAIVLTGTCFGNIHFFGQGFLLLRPAFGSFAVVVFFLDDHPCEPHYVYGGYGRERRRISNPEFHVFFLAFAFFGFFQCWCRIGGSGVNTYSLNDFERLGTANGSVSCA